MGLDMEIRVNDVDVIYMRKANAVRKWFADNLENFEDNGLTPITQENFEGIISTMESVIRDGGITGLYVDYKKLDEQIDNEEDEDTRRKSWRELFDSWEKFVKDGGRKYEQFYEVANEKFPSSSGFFFGGTDYDAWYIRDLFVNFEKFKEVYNEINWDEDEVDYWEWY